MATTKTKNEAPETVPFYEDSRARKAKEDYAKNYPPKKGKEKAGKKEASFSTPSPTPGIPK